MVSSQIEEQFGCLSRNDCVFAKKNGDWSD